jgi:heptose-I-phosphate ethanolaminephosphotransferase
MFGKIKLNKYYITYLYISIVPLIYSLLYQRQREEDFVFCLVSSFLFVLPIYFLKKPAIYFIGSSLLFWATGLFDLVHIYLYQGRISSSIFFIILDTNPTETLEFVSSNISIGIVILILSYCTGLWFLVRNAIKGGNTTYGKGFRFKVLFWILFPVLIKLSTSSWNVDKVLEAYTRSNQSFLMVQTYLKYQKQMKIFLNFSKKAKDLGIITRSKKIDEPETHILVIGESTTSQHMSLYNYHRDTNPLLSKLKGELLIFNDVANSYPPGTAGNMKKINTLANYKNENEELLSISLINIMKAAGFKTYWLSNQLLLGLHDTITTALAKQSDIHVFTNTTDSTTYDEKLLPIFEKKLSDKPLKKFIVIHLLGTHMKYRNRFPKEFEKFVDFKDIKKKPFHNKKSLQYINDYDNSVLYNDYIMNEIMQMVKKQSGIVSLIYLSDHGEEVYQNANLHGHPAIDTTGVYEIPFFVWCSNQFKLRFKDKYKRLQRAIDIPFAHDDIIHRLMDLYYIDYDKKIESLSILTDGYKPRERYIDKIRKKLRE